MSKTLKCFISYSWDSEIHKDWVRSFANQLMDNGIETSLDQWDNVPGDQIPLYMEKSVREADFVLFICTPEFASKADVRKGGVGYETRIVTSQIFADETPDRKFIPILRSGDPKTSLPSYLKGKVYIDFRDDNKFMANLETLLRNFYGEPKFKKPSLGKKPDFNDKVSISPEELALCLHKYKTPATAKTPALIIYLIDVSGSMSESFGGHLPISRIDGVSHTIQKMAIRMVQRSTKGTKVQPRYRVGLYSYSTKVLDLLGGIRTIDELAKMGIPQLSTFDMTNTAQAFEFVEDVLEQEISKIQKCPAPLIYHITDGEYVGEDPLPIMKRIMNLSVEDGNVLIENIYLKDDVSLIPSSEWKGFQTINQLSDAYAQHLFKGSSIMPESYRSIANEIGYEIQPYSRLFFPASNAGIVELAFAMSGAEPE